MRDACPYQQSFTKDFRMLWVESEEILKTAEKIIIGDIKCPRNMQRGDIYDLVMGKKYHWWYYQLISQRFKSK